MCSNNVPETEFEMNSLIHLLQIRVRLLSTGLLRTQTHYRTQLNVSGLSKILDMLV